MGSDRFRLHYVVTEFGVAGILYNIRFPSHHIPNEHEGSCKVEKQLKILSII